MEANKIVEAKHVTKEGQITRSMEAYATNHCKHCNNKTRSGESAIKAAAAQNPSCPDCLH